MANVYDVADYFINMNLGDDEGDVSNMKLQKLLYFAQGRHLAKTGQPLFDTPIEAWEHGPVLRDVYVRYKDCGNNPIPATGRNLYGGEFTFEEFDTIANVANDYGIYSAGTLREMTHRSGTPWTTVNARIKEVIPIKTIKSYFESNELPATFEECMKQKGIPILGHRNAEGKWVLPAGEYDPEDDVYEDDYNAFCEEHRIAL
jgi:uncharacterized phage-associated protein